MPEDMKKSTRAEEIIGSFKEKNQLNALLIERLERVSARLNRTRILETPAEKTDSQTIYEPCFELSLAEELDEMYRISGKLEALVRGLESFI